MSGCYYCGATITHICDHVGVGGACGREVCNSHYVPEFQDRDRPDDFSLCMAHAKWQHLPGEPIRAYFARMETMGLYAK